MSEEILTASDDEEVVVTCCDRCGTEIPLDEANDGDTGTDWEGACLCNDCYAEVGAEE